MRMRLESDEIGAILQQWAKQNFGLTEDPEVKVMIVDNYGLEDVKEDQHIDAHIELPLERILQVADNELSLQRLLRATDVAGSQG